jgi:hypothetical protein
MTRKMIQMNIWTSDDISKILIQLDAMRLPFSKYALCQEEGKLKLLGRGGSAEVYEAETRSTKKQNFAMKVIGFRTQNMDSEFFEEAVKVQEDLGIYQNDVVKIYNHTEIWVTLDEKDHVVSAVKDKPETMLRTTMKLQFVLMEKIPSVITRTKSGNIRIQPEQLARGDEQEIWKLAYDIGSALKRAHHKNVLHRDVKLENVFYSEKKKRYKLGDFGVAKKTEDGFAGTIAFTKGYAAPEVRASNDRYDNTADIYSFGIMLYVLANGLKFPDSDTYNANLTRQYEPGYVVPYPESNISKEFYHVIAKACMYNADQRYQSMDEMLLDIEKLMYGVNLGYEKEHKNSYLVVGSILFVFGVVAWKMIVVPELVISFSLWEYVFLAGCFGKGLQKAFKKDVIFLSTCILGVGIYLMVSSGFSWIKLILLLWMFSSYGASTGYFSAGAFIANVISMIQLSSGMNWYSYREYGWVAVTIVSIAVILLYQYEILSMEDRKKSIWMYKKYFWTLMCVGYAMLIILGQGLDPWMEKISRCVLGDGFIDFFLSFDRTRVGICGLVFCLIWIIREQILIFFQKKQIQKK